MLLIKYYAANKMKLIFHLEDKLKKYKKGDKLNKFVPQFN